MSVRCLVLGLLVLIPTGSYAQIYDILLKGGHVLDPKNRIDRVLDVAIAGGKIARVAANIPAAQSKHTADVSGLYVTPGLVDIHVHVYAGTGRPGAYCGDQSVYPDGHTFRNGVTTVVDAGSSGWRSFPDFKNRVIDRSRTRVLAMINIVGEGLCGQGTFEQNVADMDPAATARIAREYPDVIVAVKTAHFRGPEWVAVDRAVEAGKLANIPVMVDFGTFRPERPFRDLVLEKLRPGDIYTHLYLDPVPLLDERGKLQPYMLEARRRGIIFDLGHGAGSFLFRQAVPAIEQGFVPDSISTDLHIASMNAAMKGMVPVMSKLLNIGMPLEAVVKRSTLTPAAEIHRPDLGHLSEGAAADIAVLRMLKGRFGFMDVNGARMSGTRKLEVEMTIRDGRIVWDLNGLAREDWRKLGRYGRLSDASWDDTTSPAPTPPPKR